MYMSYFLSNELIFNKENNEILSAGFGINSILLNKGLPPILSFTSNYSFEALHQTYFFQIMAVPVAGISG